MEKANNCTSLHMSCLIQQCPSCNFNLNTGILISSFIIYLESKPRVSEHIQHAHRFFHLGVHVPFYLHFWGYIQIFGGAMYPLTLHLGYKENELHFLHARSCTMLFFVNIRGFNSNSSSDWTI
jgi:hypothetical protein